jgi:4-hydroxy-tetrahydrodipicolinate reductase
MSEQPGAIDRGSQSGPAGTDLDQGRGESRGEAIPGSIGVAVAGAAGRMGEAVCEAVQEAGDMELIARADPRLSLTLADALAHAPDVLVDFTRPDTALENAIACLQSGVHVVIGTTGFDLAALEQACLAGGASANAFVAPNFAIGAVLMMRLAAQAAVHMDAAEIIELHHDRKLDAPSGTAARTAELIAQATGGQRPPIHSVRLPGLVAHQEVILGALGQTLTIRHDSLDRRSFMPGVLLAIRRVATLTRSPLVGLEHLLFQDSPGGVG